MCMSHPGRPTAETETPMAPDVKSSSWQKSGAAAGRNSSLTGSSRRRLSEAFDKEKKPKGPKPSSPSGPLREMQRQLSFGRLRLPAVRTSPTRRALRSGADKITKTFQMLKVSVDNFSQKLTGRSRRHRRLENVDTPVATPSTKSRKILGRTPTRMYSPFSIDTPGGALASPTDTPKRGRPYSHKLFNVEQQENQRPMTRSMVQAHAMLVQPSPTCKALLD